MNPELTMSTRAFRSLPVRLGVIIALALPLQLVAGEPDEKVGKPSTYGRTPDSIIPYRHFREPYARFFQSAMNLREAGRNEAPATLPQTARIGLMYPTGSAPDADLGQEMLEGVQLALEQANADGGEAALRYRGIPFQLVRRTDTGTWGASSNEMVAFKHEDDVLAVIGSIAGANTHIALRVALKIQMPMVNTATTDPTLTETNVPWLLRCMADDRQQGYALAHHIFTECGIKRVAAFRSNDRYGRTGISEFRDAARRLKHPLRVELRWERGDRDFTTQLDRIAATKAEAIVLWGDAPDTAAIVREIRKRSHSDSTTLASPQRMPLRVFGCDRLVSRRFIEEAGEAAEGVVAVATYDPTRDEPRLRAFKKAYKRRFDRAPGTFAAHAYDGANILIAAIRKGGLNRMRIRDALYEYTHYDGVTGSIEFDTTLNDIGPVYIATVQEGEFVYEEATFTRVATLDSHDVSVDAHRLIPVKNPEPSPYRTLAESPPEARSPAHAADGARAMATEPPRSRVGCFLPLDAQGRAAVQGVRMALADDAARHPDDVPIELLVRDSRGTWGDDSSSLVDLVLSSDVLALIGSTERRGTHLAEMLAAKFHFPVITLCDTDPTITGIPLPWIFNVAPARGDDGKPLCDAADQSVRNDFARRFRKRYGAEPLRGHGADVYAALGYDAGTLVAAQIRSGARNRLALRDGLAAGSWHRGASGTFRFDALGNRIDRGLVRLRTPDARGISSRAAGFSLRERPPGGQRPGAVRHRFETGASDTQNSKGKEGTK